MALETISYGPRSLQKTATGFGFNVPIPLVKTFGFKPQDKFDFTVSIDGIITLKKVEDK